MLRNYLSAALGNLSRNWLYASITIAGLAVSFAAALLIGLYLRDEYSFDRFIRDYQRVYRIETEVDLPGAKPWTTGNTVSTVAQRLKLDFPQVERSARFEALDGLFKIGGTTSPAMIVWADPDFFKVLAYPVLAGDADAALAAPDGLVLTREMARKYFGEDAPIGKTLLVNPNPGIIEGLPPQMAAIWGGWHPMRVLAVLKDIPSNSHLSGQIFGSGRAPFSMLSLEDLSPSPFNVTTTTYVKLKAGASADAVRQGLKGFADRHYASRPGASSNVKFHLMPLGGLHFTSKDGGSGGPFDITRPPGDRKVDTGVGMVGALIVIIAAINFVTLMTARATRRAVEVGVRKAVGANRRDLVFQFMGEALIYVAVAMVLAVGLAELTLPHLNAFLRRGLKFDYLSDPAVAAILVGAALLTTVLAGLYPALTLSSFRPAATLKGGATQPAGSAGVRHALVVAQFAILVGLIVMTATIYRQTDFALHDALRLDDSQVIGMRGPCRSAFTQEAARLPGVKSLSCADQNVLSLGGSNTLVTMPDRTTRTLQNGSADVGFFEMHGLKPVAGRFFSRAQGQDMVLDRPGQVTNLQPSIVLNESGARQLGFANPADAVGKTFAWTRWSASSSPTAMPAAMPSQVIGIVPDFTLGSVRQPIQPMLYFVEPGRERFILMKLDGRTIPETLAEIDRIWKRTGHDNPAGYRFESQQVQDLYRDIITQGAALAICAGLAILIACVGLFALAAFTTERRTKEIGVRKAMGADTSDVVRLLVWQFTRPVLWANLIAWPVAFWAMDQWLHGFAYRVGLPVWLFLAASALAVAIAWATVGAQAFLAARSRPVSALRYE
jgi:putative ABC transport system permease protein